MKKKILISLIMMFALAFVVAPAVDIIGDVAHAEGIKGKISSDTNNLTKTVDNAGGSLIKTLRDIGIVGLVVILALMGYSMFIKKSADSLADMKGRLGILVIVIIFVFFTEQVVGAVFGIFGYQVN